MPPADPLESLILILRNTDANDTIALEKTQRDLSSVMGRLQRNLSERKVILSQSCENVCTEIATLTFRLCGYRYRELVPHSYPTEGDAKASAGLLDQTALSASTLENSAPNRVATGTYPIPVHFYSDRAA